MTEPASLETHAPVSGLAVARATFAAAIALIWEISARLLDSLLLPSLTETLSALTAVIVSRAFWDAFWLSNHALVAGLPLAVAAGVATGLGIARWPRAARWIDPYLNLMLAVPKSALVPLVVMAFGFGLLARSMVIFTFAYPVIAATVKASAAHVDGRLIHMARSFGASEAQIWRKILVPAALPSIMTAVRIGLARGVAGMITAELLLIAVGIGNLVLRFRADFDAASLYATVALVIAEAMLLMWLAEALERRAGGRHEDVFIE